MVVEKALLRTLVPPVVLATGTGLVVALMITLSGSPDGRPGSVRVSTHGLLIVSVGGQDGGLYPGATEIRIVRLTNPNDVEIEVTSVGAVAEHPAGCLTTVAQVQPLGEPVRVPPNGSRDVTVTVRLAATVQRACRNLRFPLAYSATTRKP